MLNTQSLSPVKLCHHPGTILPILHPCWALGSHVCTLSANGKYPALRNKLCRGARSLNFSRWHPQLREKRGPLTWQAPQLGLWTCNVWEAKGFAEPSVPITHETKMPFSFQRRTWKCWPHLTPHKIQQNERFLHGCHGSGFSRRIPQGQPDWGEGSSAELTRWRRPSEKSCQEKESENLRVAL